MSAGNIVDIHFVIIRIYITSFFLGCVAFFYGGGGGGVVVWWWWSGIGGGAGGVGGGGVVMGPHHRQLDAQAVPQQGQQHLQQQCGGVELVTFIILTGQYNVFAQIC